LRQKKTGNIELSRRVFTLPLTEALWGVDQMAERLMTRNREKLPLSLAAVERTTLGSDVTNAVGT
jgi:hypothetical protein